MFRFVFVSVFCAVAFGQNLPGEKQPSSLGEFDQQADIGNVLQAGNAEFNAANKTYSISGGGANMWYAQDDFHFVWREASAKDLSLAADISILGEGGDAHRKAILMIRQSLDSDSAYVDAARHGEGLTSLQFRDSKGGITHEVESNVSGPTRLRIEKQGDRFYMWVGTGKDDLQFSGGSARVEMKAPFYVGIGVCAHNKDALEKAVFSNVELSTKASGSKAKYSTIETVLVSGDARSGFVSSKRLRRPGWSGDGKALTYQDDGERKEVPFTPLRTAAPVGPPLVGGLKGMVSPDGKYQVALVPAKRKKEMTLRLTTVADRKVKDLATFVGGADSLGDQPWSPDGRRIVFVSYQQMR